MRNLIAATIIAAASLGGCIIAESDEPRAVVIDAGPDLVAVGGGVYVIADYDEPIFFSDGYYWWYVDGHWYRSSRYTDGWVYVASPPVVIVRIHEPHRYRHYRPHGYVVRQRPVPSHTIRRPVRDHRSKPPRVRDHRR